MNWPHAPSHWCHESGTYMVTAGTYKKLHLFSNDQKLNYLQEQLFDVADEFKWQLQAWSVFSNHYHFIGYCCEEDPKLSRMVSKLHTLTAREINLVDLSPGRKVWFQYWDKQITYEGSYLARIRYVNENPVKHGLVDVPSKYCWCSYNWFQTNASRALFKSVGSIKIDRLKIQETFKLW